VITVDVYSINNVLAALGVPDVINDIGPFYFQISILHWKAGTETYVNAGSNTMRANWGWPAVTATSWRI